MIIGAQVRVEEALTVPRSPTGGGNLWRDLQRVERIDSAES